MLKKEFLPLAIFGLLVLWVTGSWGVSLLAEDDSPNTLSSSASMTPPGTPTRSSTSTPTPPPTDTPMPTLTSSPMVTPTPSPSNTPKPMPIPLPPVTPTPEFAWQGRIVESIETGAGTIGVRAVDLKDHPVVLHSDGWHSEPQLTGTKVELGNFSTEFGGLGPGNYTVELVNLAELEVELLPGRFVLIEFWEGVVNPP